MSVENIKAEIEAGKQHFVDMPAGEFNTAWKGIHVPDTQAALTALASAITSLREHTSQAYDRTADLAVEGDEGTTLIESATKGAESSNHADLMFSVSNFMGKAIAGHQLTGELKMLTDLMDAHVAELTVLMKEYHAMHYAMEERGMPQALAALPGQIVQHADRYLETLG